MTTRLVRIVPILVAALVLLALAQINAPNAAATHPVPEREYITTGDVQCDNDVDVIDALMIQRFDAGLSTFQTEPCPEIDQQTEIIDGDFGIGEPPFWDHFNWYFGDNNCDSLVNLADATRILRYDAGLFNEPCGKVAPDGTYVIFVTGAGEDPDDCLDMWHYPASPGTLCPDAIQIHGTEYKWFN